MYPWPAFKKSLFGLRRDGIFSFFSVGWESVADCISIQRATTKTHIRYTFFHWNPMGDGYQAFVGCICHECIPLKEATNTVDTQPCFDIYHLLYLNIVAGQILYTPSRQ